MSESNPFVELLTRVRAGDPDAAAELVRRYEPAVRVVVRTRMADASLRRHFDSLDLCQSVLGSFFVRAAAGQYELSEPAQLVALLAAMARNKVGVQVRRHRRDKRDARRVTGGDEALAGVAAVAPTPSEVVADRELLAVVLGRLTPEERELARRRGNGDTWGQIATEMGGTPEGRRKELARAIDRVGADLGLGEEA